MNNSRFRNSALTLAAFASLILHLAPGALAAETECPAAPTLSQLHFQQPEGPTRSADLEMINRDGTTQGRVVDSIRKGGQVLTFYNGDRKAIASLRRSSSRGSYSQAEVVDCNGRKVGSLEEKVVRNLFTGHSQAQYRVLGSGGEMLAQSQWVDADGKDFALNTPKGQFVGYFYRPELYNRNPFDVPRGIHHATWKSEVGAGHGVDRRLILMMPAFKTASDFERTDPAGARASARERAISGEPLPAEQKKIIQPGSARPVEASISTESTATLAN